MFSVFPQLYIGLSMAFDNAKECLWCQSTCVRGLDGQLGRSLLDDND